MTPGQPKGTGWQRVCPSPRSSFCCAPKFGCLVLLLGAVGNQAVGKHLFTLGKRNLKMWEQVPGVELGVLPREPSDAGAALAL